MSNWDEQIVVVSRDKLFDGEKLAFQGAIIRGGKDDSIGERIIKNIEANYQIMRRGNKKDTTPADSNSEINTAMKQIIPYAVIRKGDKIFLYKRLDGGGESRLHEKLSIGVGGHMNDLDEAEKALISNIGFTTLLTDNLDRELNEELFITSSEQQEEIIGVVNDDSDEVGQVHFCILIVVDLDEDAVVEVNEPEQLEGEWVGLEYLLKEEVFNKLENWSQISVKALAGE